MELVRDKKNCCGCGACAHICPKGAITMTADEDGFHYPVIDSEKCVECGLCLKVCAFQKADAPKSRKEVYTAVSADTDLQKSASGGMFASFAQAVIADGGVVYGCAMEYENGRLWPRHICVSDQKDLIKLKGSKYVQSDLGNAYPNIRHRLDAGQTVLFSGTPCQVAGLKGYLRKDYDNLFTLDLICHGVPSVKMFHDYLAFEEKRMGTKITAFRFRDKSAGWKLHGAMSLEDGRTVHFEPEESSYYQMFLNSYTYRESCYRCPYASEHRSGDITIGDFWCIELVHPELLHENGGLLEHEKGVSCLIVNNEKGKVLLEKYGRGIRRWESTYKDASKYNRQLTAPSVLKPERGKAMALCRKGYEKVEKWYRRRLRPVKFRRAVRAAVPRSIKQTIKNVLRKNK